MDQSIESLRAWSHVLLWLSIIFPLLGGVSAGARYYVERREKQLSTANSVKQMAALNSNLETTREKAENATEQNLALSKKLEQSERTLSELQQLTAPRKMTAPQRTQLLRELSRIHEVPITVACRAMDGESLDFAEQIRSLFVAGGWAAGTLNKSSFNDFHGTIAISGPADTEHTISALISVFDRAGLKLTRQAPREKSISGFDAQRIWIIIGRK